MAKNKLTFDDHLAIAEVLRLGKSLSGYYGDKILNSIPANSRLYRSVLKLDRILLDLSSQLEAQYYKDTIPSERVFPNDQIHWGNFNSLQPKPLKTLDAGVQN